MARMDVNRWRMEFLIKSTIKGYVCEKETFDQLPKVLADMEIRNIIA